LALLAGLFGLFVGGTVITIVARGGGLGTSDARAAFSSTLLAAALVLAAKGVVDGLASWARAPLMPVATSVGVLVAVGMRCWLSSVVPAAPFAPVDTKGMLFTWGTWDTESTSLMNLLGVTFIVCIIPPTCALVVFLAACVLSKLKHAFVARLMLGSGATAFVMLLGLTVAAAGGARMNPTFDRQIADPSARTIRLRLAGITRLFSPGHGADLGDPRNQPKLHRNPVGDLTVVHACDALGLCKVGILNGGDSSGLVSVSQVNAPVVRDDAEFAVLRYAPDVVLINATWKEGETDPLHYYYAAFRRVDDRWQAVQYPPKVVTQYTRAPRAWIYCGVFGSALCFLLWGARLLFLHRDRSIVSPRSSAKDNSAVGYRDIFEVKSIDRPGNHVLLAQLDATILSVACLAASPLAAAALVGIA
jgi:hypothetical protein